jgi:O-antigen ligase
MVFPVLVSFIFLKDYSYTKRMLALAFLIIVSIAIVFSYTRATWVSMFIAAIFFLIILFRVKFRTIAIISITTIVALLLFWTQIWMNLERNRQDSSSNLSEQIESITNISTDASNMERLNRWNCAIRMWRERPLTGWGPGTYMFLYAPFQFSYEKTIISTNFGDLGNAHSEYLGPLAETGVPGTISVLVIFIMSIYYGMRVIRKTKNRNERILVIAVLVGLITYYVHGFLNNFLDTDKLSVLVWGYIAIIVVTDIAAQRAEVSVPKKSEDGIEKQTG